VAAYLLTPLDHLCGLDPSQLDRANAIAWIRRTELPWAPGRADLERMPWDELEGLGTEVELVTSVLKHAAEEAQAAASTDAAATGALQLATRRRVLLSTLEAYSEDIRFPRTTSPTADPHVHQGAALPLEVMLHWVAGQIRSIGRRDPSQQRLVDSNQNSFYALPLMLALRAVLDEHPSWKHALELGQRAARPNGADAWAELNDVVSFDDVHEAQRDRRGIVDLKREAVGQWEPARRIALFRLESVLQGSVMQTEPGLNVFVRAFEGLASIRRKRFQKTEYYRRAIQVYIDESPHLVASEMRLGEPVFSARLGDDSPRPWEVSQLAAEYRAALEGYALTAGRKARPVAITFPLGMVKTKDEPSQTENWRFDPTVIYALTEALIELLEECPELTRFVDGLDVCGKEDDAPNWLFAPAYSRFAHWAAKHDRPTTLRFHAGEWQSTPVHGLRRIAEFLAFDVPPGTALRVGHGLALETHDWSRLPEQTVDEVLDDCVWSYKVLRDAGPPTEVLRMLERAVIELWPFAYPALARPPIERIVRAYAARQDLDTLRRIAFIAPGDRLAFVDGIPVARPDSDDQLVVAHLRTRAAPVPTLRAAMAQTTHVSADVEKRISQLRLVLSDVYDELVSEVLEDLRWKRVIVEACPTSNVIVGGVRGYRRHPAVSVLKHGGLVTVGTDDPSLFHTWTAHEAEVSRQFMAIPSGQAQRSQELAVATVAAGIPREDIPGQLDAAIAKLTEIARGAA